MFIRRAIIDIVLCTDMAVHGDLLKRFHAAVALQGNDLSLWDDHGRTTAMQMFVHCADIANPVKPAFFAGKWSRRIMDGRCRVCCSSEQLYTEGFV